MGLMVHVIGNSSQTSPVTRAEVIVTDGHTIERLRAIGGNLFVGLMEKAGTFKVFVLQRGSVPVERTVHISRDRCHVIPRHLTVTLNPS